MAVGCLSIFQPLDVLASFDSSNVLHCLLHVEVGFDYGTYMVVNHYHLERLEKPLTIRPA